MATLIVEVTVQVSLRFNTFKVFTEYKNNGNIYTGFDVYKNLEEAIEGAKKMVRTYNDSFKSVCKGYSIKTFKIDTNEFEGEFIIL